MSLNVGKTPQRPRSRSRSRISKEEETFNRDTRSEQSYVDAKGDSYGRHSSSRRGHERTSSKSNPSAPPYPQDGGIPHMVSGSHGVSDHGSHYTHKAPSPPTYTQGYHTSEAHIPGAFPDDDQDAPMKYEKTTQTKYGRQNNHHGQSSRERNYEQDHRSGKHSRGSASISGLAKGTLYDLLPQKVAEKIEDTITETGIERKERKRREKERDEDHLAYGKLPGPSKKASVLSPRPPRQDSSYTDPIHRGEVGRDDRHSNYQRPRDSREDGLTRGRTDSYRDGPHAKDHRRDGSRERSRHRDTLPPYPDDRKRPESRERTRDRSRDRHNPQDTSPQPPLDHMTALIIGNGRHPPNMSVSNVLISPLLESYHGTYQKCSPMPSPIVLASKFNNTGSISPVTSDSEQMSPTGKREKRARFHDAPDNAERLASALKGDEQPDKMALIDILPSLTHDQVLEIRAQYKQIVKTGPQGKGVNLAKHIRSRLKNDNPNLMKACYSVALGMWGSEAYWANFWYQGDKARRELLIESLMGRTNEEIRQIKDAFSDKTYDKCLFTCLKMELKEDKFKEAVLLALEGRRMEETDESGNELPINYDLVYQDTQDLRKAIKSEKGESDMLSIVVTRSDSHLQAILKEYRLTYSSNFAHDALDKSRNLVGELLAHILNGVINRPVRDAILLHHTLTVAHNDELRHELLTSRLVRLHWDCAHMSKVRKAYREKYKMELVDAVKESTTGHWGQFLAELCIARMPHDVRTFDAGKVQFSSVRR